MTNDFYSAESPSVSESSFLCMNSLFDELGVLVSPEKDTLPCHQLLCLGVMINTLERILTVPSFRVVELQLELRTWLYKPNFTKRQLHQPLGKLSYVLALVWVHELFVKCLVVLFIFSEGVFPSCY